MKGLVFDTTKIDEAEGRRTKAKELLDKPDHAGCIRESQAAVELMTKTLFDYLGLSIAVNMT